MNDTPLMRRARRREVDGSGGGGGILHALGSNHYEGEWEDGGGEDE